MWIFSLILCVKQLDDFTDFISRRHGFYYCVCFSRDATFFFPFLIRINENIFSLNRYDKSGNEQFVTELSKWVFHERGHLKVNLDN